VKRTVILGGADRRALTPQVPPNMQPESGIRNVAASDVVNRIRMVFLSSCDTVRA
jgi:hypothetical protein